MFTSVLVMTADMPRELRSMSTSHAAIHASLPLYDILSQSFSMDIMSSQVPSSTVPTML